MKFHHWNLSQLRCTLPDPTGSATTLGPCNGRAPGLCWGASLWRLAPSTCLLPPPRPARVSNMAPPAPPTSTSGLRPRGEERHPARVGPWPSRSSVPRRDGAFEIGRKQLEESPSECRHEDIRSCNNIDNVILYIALRFREFEILPTAQCRSRIAVGTRPLRPPLQ